MSSFSESRVAGLRSQIQGVVVAPGDGDYESARRGWNLAVDQHPAVIVLASNAADVAEAVRFAGREGLGVAVQTTGHGTILPGDGALLIKTAPMAGVRVDAEARTARVEAGTKWGAVLVAAQAHGLAPLLGSSPTVGAIGYTLGGGMGWLGRKYGLAVDTVQALELVTGDGQLRRASASENADLFWALRGGGGSFGVVTAMEIGLFPVSTVYGGSLIYPAAVAKEVLTRFREWIGDAPEELTSAVALMNLPPLPVVPEFLRGKSVVMVRGCYCGPVVEGEALLRPWREWMTPLADMFGEMPFTEVAAISNDPQDPVPAIASGAWMDELSDGAIDTLIRFGVARNGPSPLVSTEVRHAGGAIARGDEGAMAMDYRSAPFLLNLIAMTPTPEVSALAHQHITHFKEALRPQLSSAVYLNFVHGEEGWERTPEAFRPETYRRLRAIKAKYDPENLFRFSFNIPPA